MKPDVHSLVGHRRPDLPTSRLPSLKHQRGFYEIRRAVFHLRADRLCRRLSRNLQSTQGSLQA